MPEKKPRGLLGAYRREIVVALLIIVLFTVFVGRGQADVVGFQFGESQMTISGPEGTEPVTLDYAGIRAMSQRSGLELGSCVDGLDTAACRFGTWDGGELGRLTLCAVTKVSEYIVLDTDQGIVVCNYKDADATVHLYTALVELLESKGLEVSTGAG